MKFKGDVEFLESDPLQQKGRGLAARSASRGVQGGGDAPGPTVYNVVVLGP